MATDGTRVFLASYLGSSNTQERVTHENVNYAGEVTVNDSILEDFDGTFKTYEPYSGSFSSIYAIDVHYRATLDPDATQGLLFRLCAKTMGVSDMTVRVWLWDYTLNSGTGGWAQKGLYIATTCPSTIDIDIPASDESKFIGPGDEVKTRVTGTPVNVPVDGTYCLMIDRATWHTRN